MPTRTGISPKNREALARAALWTSVLLWAAVIFSISSIPGSRIPGRLGPYGHFVEYFVLGVLLYLALRRDVAPRQAVILALVLASLYGVTDEFHQRFVVLRTPDVADWAVDTAGATLGALAARGAEALARRKRAPHSG